MKINQIMTRDVQALRPEQSIRDAARIDTGALLVHEDGRLVRMVTDRDIPLRAVAEDLDGTTPVRRFMGSGVRYYFDDKDVQQVARNMAHNRMRRLPVLNRQKRLVSLGNIASTFSDRAQSTVLLGVAQAH